MQKIIDPRDIRGKRHELAFVLTSFLYSALRVPGRLNISKIHRMMEREHGFLSLLLGQGGIRCISAPQLRRILHDIDYQEYNSLNEDYFGISIEHGKQGWYAIDGKELRGGIDSLSGQKRAENVVRMVDHESKTSQVIGYYRGDKESEKTIVGNYFTGGGQLRGNYSMDALHTSVGVLSKIEGCSGKYLAQVKNNQKFLYQDCRQVHRDWAADWKTSEWHKGHGRQELRDGYCYKVPAAWFGDKWTASGLATLVVIERGRLRGKDQKRSAETAFFISNLELGQETGMELFQAARNHWAIEADHHVRDVGLGEDKIVCFDSNRNRMVAALINTIVNMIRINNRSGSIVGFREDMCYDKKIALNCFKR